MLRLRAIRCLIVAAVAAGVALTTQAKTPDGWRFIEYNEAVSLAKKSHKPLFVYFGFETCPYCEIANRNTFSSELLRKRYSEHYVLAYFDIRGNPADVMTLPGGEKMTRADAIKRMRSVPVPAWAFVSFDGRDILMRRGSRTPVEAFVQLDDYVSSNDGGAIANEDGDVYAYGNTFQTNKAGGDGGAIYGDNHVEISGNRFIGNRSYRGIGGAAYAGWDFYGDPSANTYRGNTDRYGASTWDWD